MKDVHRSRGYFLSQRAIHEGKSRGKKGRFPQEKENPGKRAKKRARGDVLDHVFCVRDHIGLAIVLHIKVERANVLHHLVRDIRTLHRFDKLIWGRQTSLDFRCRCLCHLVSITAEFRKF